MDPISAVFAALMDTVAGVSGQLSEGATSHISDTAGLQRQHIEMQYVVAQ